MQTERQFWNNEALSWRKHQDLFGQLTGPVFRQIKQELELLLRVTGDRGLFLNLGSGVNNKTYFKNNKDSRIIAIDFSSEMLRRNQAQEKIQADLNHPIPLKKESVDAVVSFFLMRYLFLEAQIRLLEEIYRVLRPGRWGFIADLKKGAFPHQKVEFDPAALTAAAITLGFSRAEFNSKQHSSRQVINLGGYKVKGSTLVTTLNTVLLQK